MDTSFHMFVIVRNFHKRKANSGFYIMCIVLDAICNCICNILVFQINLLTLYFNDEKSYSPIAVRRSSTQIAPHISAP